MLRPLTISAFVFLAASVLTGCATRTEPVSYQGLASAGLLTANLNDEDGQEPFLYAANDVDWSRYDAVILDPITIYEGPDHQFGDLSQDDKADLAAYAQTSFAAALKTRYAVTDAPNPGALRVHVTLTGCETNMPVLSTLTKISPVGLVINTVQTARNKQGTGSGSISYAIEIYDSAADRLLRAYVSKQYPFAENIAASFGSLDAARAGIRNGSEDLIGQLR